MVIARVAARLPQHGDIPLGRKPYFHPLRFAITAVGAGSAHESSARDPIRRDDLRPVHAGVFAPDSKGYLTGAYGGILRQVSDGRDIARYGE